MMKTHGRLFVSIMTVVAATSFFASSQASAIAGIDQVVETNTQSIRYALKLKADEAEKQRAADVEAKKAQLREKLEERRANISEFLSGERAKRCQAKEIAINNKLDNRYAAALKHFERFKAVQDRLTTFVDENSVVVNNDKALRVIMNDEQTASQTAVSVLRDMNFVCDQTSSTNPGMIVKSQVTDAKEALKQYRDAIKQYAEAVKTSIPARGEQ